MIAVPGPTIMSTNVPTVSAPKILRFDGPAAAIVATGSATGCRGAGSNAGPCCGCCVVPGCCDDDGGGGGVDPGGGGGGTLDTVPPRRGKWAVPALDNDCTPASTMRASPNAVSRW